MRDISAFIKEYTQRYPDGDIRFDEKMNGHTSFRIGGTAKYFFVPKGADELAWILTGLKETECPVLVMGNGSNLLVRDGKLDMAVVKIGEGMNEIKCDGTAVTAGAGALLGKVSAAARDNSLTGFEFACGIPGSVGGGVYMNAGAYGGEIKDVLKSVDVLDEDMTVRTYSVEECDLSYRHSRFEERGGIIVSAVFELENGDKDEISSQMEDLFRRRREKQPVELPSAGSTFKRPESGYAAEMIDKAGLKGLAVGGAQVSPKHSGFVVNTGGATFDDVTALMKQVQEKVYEAYGVMLEPEVKIIG